MAAESNGDNDSELISIVAHDLKTPVGAARGFLDLVEHSGALNERQRHFLGRARASLNRMDQLIASLLDYARIHSGNTIERVVVDIHELVQESLELLEDVAAQRNVTIHLPENAKPIIVLVDKRLLGHVISNLLSNAIKYNKSDGDIWIDVRQQGPMVRVDVRDSGIGISNEMQKRIFERFYRGVKQNEDGKIEGSGLGLAICQSIVELHGGHIWVASTLGEGSLFSFTIPIEPEENNLREQSKGKSRLPGE